MEKPKPNTIKIMKLEIEKDDFLYITENGICGTLMRDPFYRMELYRSPIQNSINNSIASISDLWDILSAEKDDIHLKDYPPEIKKITEKMEKELLANIIQVEHKEKYELFSMICKNRDLMTWFINLFVYAVKLRNY